MNRCYSINIFPILHLFNISYLISRYGYTTVITITQRKMLPTYFIRHLIDNIYEYFYYNIFCLVAIILLYVNIQKILLDLISDIAKSQNE